MTARPGSELLSLLLERAVELTGNPAQRLVDEDGDVALADSPFNAWGRIHVSPGEGSSLVFVMTPLVGLQESVELDDLVKRTLADRSVAYAFGGNAVQLFAPCPPAVLDLQEVFAAAFASAMSIGKEVVRAVQPRMGGLTSEQHRVLAGWRGVNDQVEADLRAVLGEGGLLAHGWDPRRESVPLLVSEKGVPGGWANRFVTVDGEGSVRLRSTVPGVRDGARGFTLTIHRLDPDAARTWAQRLGLQGPTATVDVERIEGFAGRPWQELVDAMLDLPQESGDAWQEVGPVAP